MDTVGQEKYRPLAQIFQREAKAIIFVYDITNKYSFESIQNYLYKDVKLKNDKNPILALVAKKIEFWKCLGLEYAKKKFRFFNVQV